MGLVSHNDLRYIIYFSYDVVTLGLQVVRPTFRHRLTLHIATPTNNDSSPLLCVTPIQRLFRHYLKLLKNYQKMVGVSGFEPPLYRFSYHYNFHYTFLFCGLDFLFIITFLFQMFAVKSLHLLISELGSGLAVKLSPNLTNSTLEISL